MSDDEVKMFSHKVDLYLSELEYTNASNAFFFFAKSQASFYYIFEALAI